MTRMSICRQWRGAKMFGSDRESIQCKYRDLGVESRDNIKLYAGDVAKKEAVAGARGSRRDRGGSSGPLRYQV